MTTSRSDGEATALLRRLDHVGLAVPSIAAALPLYRRLFGPAAVGTPFDLPEQGVRVCFVAVECSAIELIEPIGDASPLARFLERNPAGGQHHLCFAVPDLAAAVSSLEAAGARCLGAPRPGAHGLPVVFLHPRSMGGLLVELVEEAAP